MNIKLHYNSVLFRTSSRFVAWDAERHDLHSTLRVERVSSTQTVE